MQLEFISRKNYQQKENFKIELQDKFGDHVLIPEGGYSKQGVKGAALIQGFYKEKKFTHVCCAVGTATTLAGLITSATADQQIIGFSVLKGFNDFEERIQFLFGTSPHKKYFLIPNYHFGGYAKKTPELLSFMNKFCEESAIPTDFVYTGKMMFGVFDLIKKNYFPAGSNVLCIHTGGLQGNLSLTPGTLNF
jgi:1-aminocyclopropane-1-carboxylate deaminase